MATARTAVRVLRLGRLHFVLAGLLLFSWGALLAVLAGAEAAWGRFALGYLVLFPAHLSVSYSNDYFDAEADAYGTPTLFTGGSGILQAEPALRPLARAIALGLIGLSLVMGIVFAWRYGGGVGFVGLVLLGNLLGWFYAAPPLRLSYRGLGEAATAAMVGFLLPALGFLVMAGALEGPFLLVAPALLLYGASFIVAVQIPTSRRIAWRARTPWWAAAGGPGRSRPSACYPRWPPSTSSWPAGSCERCWRCPCGRWVSSRCRWPSPGSSAPCGAPPSAPPPRGW